YNYAHLGNNPRLLDDIAQGRHDFSNVLKGAKNPMVIVGAGALNRKDGTAVHFRARQIAENLGMIREDWNGFNVLQTAAARTGALDVGFVPTGTGKNWNDILFSAASGQVSVVYLLGVDEMDMAKLGRAFVIYQGHHGDRGAERADVILPGAAYTEKNALYVNTEGRPQLARLATFPPGEAREDWKIVRALSEQLGHTLPYDSLTQLRRRLVELNPVFGNIGAVTPAPW